MIIRLALGIIVAVPAIAHAKPASKLRGVLVVIDPGHGGLDDGASGRVRGERVVEDEHVYDVALRLRDMVRADGGQAVIIVPSSGATPASRAVARALGQRPDRTRQCNGASADDLLASGDRDHGIRRLYVLSNRNPFRERMLIELGNFRNARDLWRIREPRVRQDFAARIARGIIAWAHQWPPSRTPKSRSTTALVRR